MLFWQNETEKDHEENNIGIWENGKSERNKPIKTCFFRVDICSSELTPLYLMSICNEPSTLSSRITISLVWPSRFEKRGCSARVSGNGMKLEVVLKWPAPLIDLKLTQKKWLADPTVRNDEYCPEFVGFSVALKAFRLRSSDWLESKAEINLQFSFQRFIHNKNNFAWRDDSTRMIYIF